MYLMKEEKERVLPSSGQSNQEIREFYHLESNHQLTENKREGGKEKNMPAFSV